MSSKEEGDFSPSFAFLDFITTSPSLDKQRKYRIYLVFDAPFRGI